MIDAMPEQSEGPARTFDAVLPAVQRNREEPVWTRVVGLALVMVTFMAIGMFAYSVYASGAESDASGEVQGRASTLVRASTPRAESVSPSWPATIAAPLRVETVRVVPDTTPRASRVAARDVDRTGRVRAADPELGGNAGPRAPATKLRYWRTTTAEPDVGF